MKIRRIIRSPILKLLQELLHPIVGFSPFYLLALREKYCRRVSGPDERNARQHVRPHRHVRPSRTAESSPVESDIDASGNTEERIRGTSPSYLCRYPFNRLAVPPREVNGSPNRSRPLPSQYRSFSLHLTIPIFFSPSPKFSPPSTSSTTTPLLLLLSSLSLLLPPPAREKLTATVT